MRGSRGSRRSSGRRGRVPVDAPDRLDNPALDATMVDVDLGRAAAPVDAPGVAPPVTEAPRRERAPKRASGGPRLPRLTGLGGGIGNWDASGHVVRDMRRRRRRRKSRCTMAAPAWWANTTNKVLCVGVVGILVLAAVVAVSLTAANGNNDGDNNSASSGSASYKMRSMVTYPLVGVTCTQATTMIPPDAALKAQLEAGVADAVPQVEASQVEVVDAVVLGCDGASRRLRRLLAEPAPYGVAVTYELTLTSAADVNAASAILLQSAATATPTASPGASAAATAAASPAGSTGQQLASSFTEVTGLTVDGPPVVGQLVVLGEDLSGVGVAGATPTASGGTTIIEVVSESPSTSETSSNSPTVSNSASNTGSPSTSASATRTGTPTASITESATPTRTSAASASPSRTPTPTTTNSGSGTPAASGTPSASITSGASATRTPVASESETSAPSDSSAPSASETGTSAASATPTASVSLSVTPTSSESESATRTETPAASGTPSPTVSDSPSGTASPSESLSVGASPSNTGSNSPTVSTSASPTLSVSASASSGSASVSGAASPPASSAAAPEEDESDFDRAVDAVSSWPPSGTTILIFVGAAVAVGLITLLFCAIRGQPYEYIDEEENDASGVRHRGASAVGGVSEV